MITVAVPTKKTEPLSKPVSSPRTGRIRSLSTMPLSSSVQFLISYRNIPLFNPCRTRRSWPEAFSSTPSLVPLTSTQWAVRLERRCQPGSRLRRPVPCFRIEGARCDPSRKEVVVELRGSCHCGAVSFRVDSPTPYPYLACYCSICRKTAGGGGYAINLC